VCVFLFGFCLCLTGCIGVSTNLQSKHAGEMALLEKSAPPPSSSNFIGQTRDAIITRYGAPSRSTKLDNGLKTFEYRTTLRYRNNNHYSPVQACSVRFWYRDTIITSTDYLGTPRACELFLQNSKRNNIICQNGLLCFGDEQ